jgi:hypothetical protein
MPWGDEGMAGPKTIENLQDIALRIIVVLAALTAVVHEVWKSFPDWALTVILFLAVLAILIQIEKVLRTMRSVERKQNEILADHTRVKVYNTYEEFYRDMRLYTSDARHIVRASYMRRFPPASLGGEAELFFDSVIKWARRDPNHVLRRVVCKPEGQLLEWVQAQDKCSQAKNSRYWIKIVDWTVRDVDAVSVAIIDEDLVFFVFSGAEDSMKGFSIRSARVASYFIEYHNQLWLSAVSLKEFMSKKLSGN